MNLYGQRFLTARQFSSYCESVNVRLLPSNEELERYEKYGAIFPAARLIKPEEYLSERRKLDNNPQTYGQKLSGWDEIERILYSSKRDIEDKFDLWNNLDAEFELGNKFLIKPLKDEYKKWNSYKVNISHPQLGNMIVDSAEHYYHYYQVHQVYAVQKKYPVFAKNYWFIANLKENIQIDKSYFLPSEDDVSSTLSGNLPFYEALSFFIELYINERHITFDSVQEEYGVRTLNDTLLQDYQKRIKQLALFVFDKFELKTEHFYNFLLFALELHNTYQEDEKSKLANDLMADMQYATIFLANVSELHDKDIEKEIQNRNPTLVKKFRYSDRTLEIRDYAKEAFGRLSLNYNNNFSDMEISSEAIDRLLTFMDEKGLFIAPYSIFDIDKTLNTDETFRANSLYVGLSGLLIGFESFLREIANKANNSHNESIKIENLDLLIRTMFSWGKNFQSAHEKLSSLKENKFEYLERVHTSLDIDLVIRNFLIVRHARNKILHNYTLDQFLYQIWYSKIYLAICESFFYSWIYASQRKWV